MIPRTFNINTYLLEFKQERREINRGLNYSMYVRRIREYGLVTQFGMRESRRRKYCAAYTKASKAVRRS